MTVGPHAAHFEAVGGPFQNEPARERCDHRQQEARRQPAPGGNLGRRLDQWRASDDVRARAVLPGVRGQPVRQVAGHEVQHDRHDHLVRPGSGLQHTGDRAPRRTGNPAHQQCQRQVDDQRQAVDPEPDTGSERSTDQQLALAADVEQPRLECERHRQAAEDERRGFLQRAQHSVGIAGPTQHQRSVGAEHRMALHGDEHRSEDEPQHDRCQRHGGCAQESSSSRAVGTAVGATAPCRFCLSRRLWTSEIAHNEVSFPRPTATGSVRASLDQPGGHPVSISPAFRPARTSSSVARMSSVTMSSKSWNGARPTSPR